jgi:hypothetical protein
VPALLPPTPFDPEVPLPDEPLVEGLPVSKPGPVRSLLQAERPSANAQAA